MAADFATTAASALTGDAGAHLAVAHTFTAAATPGTSTALGDLARQSSDAAQFAPPGVHHHGGYSTVTRQVSSWLANRIDAPR